MVTHSMQQAAYLGDRLLMMLDSDSQLRHVVPKVLEAFRASEQGSENRRVGEQDVSATATFWRHPDARIELAIPRSRERMWPR